MVLARGQRGLGHALLYSFFTRITDDVDYVGKNKTFKKQNIDFVVDGSVFYGTRVDLRARPFLSFETIAKFDEKGVIREYGWVQNNKAHFTIMIRRDNFDCIMYFFQPGEILTEIKNNPGYGVRYKTNGVLKEFYNIPLTYFSHKKPVRIPIVGEPDVSGLAFVHDYAKEYLAF